MVPGSMVFEDFGKVWIFMLFVLVKKNPKSQTKIYHTESKAKEDQREKGWAKGWAKRPTSGPSFIFLCEEAAVGEGGLGPLSAR